MIGCRGRAPIVMIERRPTWLKGRDLELGSRAQSSNLTLDRISATSDRMSWIDSLIVL